MRGERAWLGLHLAITWPGELLTLLQTLLPCTAQSTVTKWLYLGPGRLRTGDGFESQGGLPLGNSSQGEEVKAGKNKKWRQLGGWVPSVPGAEDSGQ